MLSPEEPVRYKEIIIKGTIGQIQALVEIEQTSRENRSRDQISKMMLLRFHGPIRSGSPGGSSAYWMIDNGSHIVLDMLQIGHGSGAGGPWGYLALSPNMSFEEMDREARKLGVSLPEVLGLGVLRVAELPDNRLRVIFDVGGYESPHSFWQWSDSFIEELVRQGFLESLGGQGRLASKLPTPAAIYLQANRDIKIGGDVTGRDKISATSIEGVSAERRTITEDSVSLYAYDNPPYNAVELHYFGGEPARDVEVWLRYTDQNEIATRRPVEDFFPSDDLKMIWRQFKANVLKENDVVRFRLLQKKHTSNGMVVVEVGAIGAKSGIKIHVKKDFVLKH